MERTDWVVLGIIVLILYVFYSGLTMLAERNIQSGLEKQV